MPKIFVSYRRIDSQERAHRIADWLVNIYSSENVFIDIAGIPGASDFAKEIEYSLNDTDVLIVVIGDNWVNELERRATSNEIDYVHFEVAKGLHDGLKVIPVLLDHNVSVDSSRLHENVQQIASLNFMYARMSDFHHDMERIQQVIDSAPEIDRKRSNKLSLYQFANKVQKSTTSQSRQIPYIPIIVTVSILAVAIFGGLILTNQSLGSDIAPTLSETVQVDAEPITQTESDLSKEDLSVTSAIETVTQIGHLTENAPTDTPLSSLMPTNTDTHTPTHTSVHTLTPTFTTTATQAVISTPTTIEKSYPCEGKIEGAGGLLNRIHSLPKTGSPLRNPVKKGDTVTILQTTTDFGSNWYEIESEDTSGWLESDYITLSEACP